MGEARNKQLFYERLAATYRRFAEQRAREAATPPPETMICHCGGLAAYAYRPSYFGPVFFFCEMHRPDEADIEQWDQDRKQVRSMINAANREGPTTFTQPPPEVLERFIRKGD